MIPHDWTTVDAESGRIIKYRCERCGLETFSVNGRGMKYSFVMGTVSVTEDCDEAMAREILES